MLFFVFLLLSSFKPFAVFASYETIGVEPKIEEQNDHNVRLRGNNIFEY